MKFIVICFFYRILNLIAFAAMPETKAFLFDVEGVLRKGNLALIAPAFESIRGVNARRFPRALGGDAEEIPEVFRLAREGVFGPQEFRLRIKTELLTGAAALTDEEFDKAYCAAFPDHLDPEPFNVVKDLRALGYRCFILSNNNFIHTELLRRQACSLLGPAGLAALFEGEFFSYEIGARKPDAEAFTIALSQMNVPAERVVFIDDKPRNIKAATAVGLNTILLQDFNHLRHEVTLFLNKSAVGSI